MEKQSKIICPECGHEFDVQEVLKHQVEEKIRLEYHNRLNEERLKYEQQANALQTEKAIFEEEKKKEKERFQEKVDAQLKVDREQITKSLKKQIESEQADQLKVLTDELNEKSQQVKELNRSKAEIERLKREKEELRDSIEAELQKSLNSQLTEERERIRKNEHEKSELAIRELQKQLDDQKKLTEEMKRKQEQGSMQLQGEVQELAIEEWLAQAFPLDTIEEIKKGVRGGDCIQIVNTRTHQNCGRIYYESKRTKDFQTGWIEKFKNDIREKCADIGVLVTDSMPSGMERMGLKDGIWICTYEESKGLSIALRESIIRISNALSIQENKGEKMVMLYDYLTSNEFRMSFEAIIEGFMQMQNDLTSEKRAIQGIWKKREKQIEKVLLNTNFTYNSIRGIAGNAVQPIKALELKESVLEEESLRKEL